MSVFIEVGAELGWNSGFELGTKFVWKVRFDCVGNLRSKQVLIVV